MKRILIILVFLSFFTILIFDVPKYNELNNISVIDKITIKCRDNYYDINMREVTLLRKDNGITFRYDYYKNKIKNINKIKENNLDKYHKVFYYDRIKSIDTNCSNVDDFKKIFNNNINIKRIKS